MRRWDRGDNRSMEEPLYVGMQMTDKWARGVWGDRAQHPLSWLCEIAHIPAVVHVNGSFSSRLGSEQSRGADKQNRWGKKKPGQFQYNTNGPHHANIINNGPFSSVDIE